MKIQGVEIQNQGSEIWKGFRKSRITSTDVSCIMGLNPWCSKRTLWLRKMDLEPEQAMNHHMQRGKDLEQEARDLYCKITVTCLEPEVHVHSTYNWCMASLDGINLDGDEILEIKCPAKAPPEEVPPMYYCQMQWQMFCSGANLCHYVVYFDKDIRSWPVKRDEEFINKCFDAAQKFRESLINFEEPNE